MGLIGQENREQRFDCSERPFLLHAENGTSVLESCVEAEEESCVD